MTNYFCTLRGSLASSTLQEQFIHSLCIVSAADAGVVSSMVMSSWKTEWEAAGTGMASLFSSGVVTYTEATAAQIIGQEVTGDLAAAQHTPFTPPLGGQDAAGSLPSQIATVVSLTGGFRPNGMPMKGRFYVPPMASSHMAIDGTINTVSQQKLADGVARFINTLNSAGHKVSIWSRTHGTIQQVTTLRVGNKFDTMRSRRNKLPETYVLKSITP